MASTESPRRRESRSSSESVSHPKRRCNTMIGKHMKRASVVVIAGAFAAVFGTVAPVQAQAPSPATVEATEHRHHPRRRPGIRRHGRVRQRDQDAEPRRAGGRGRALHELLHPRELLAHALHAADRRRYAPQRPRQHGRVDRAQPAGRWTATRATSTTGWSRCRSCSRAPATTPTWSASGTWARRPTRSRRRADSSATSRCSTGRAATGT